MDKQEWLKLFRDNEADLIGLISSYHPGSLGQTVYPDTFITARAAERACESIRAEIKSLDEGDPVANALQALEREDTGTLYRIISQTWFGIPEAFECRRLPGFYVLCDLASEYEGEVDGTS